MIKINLEATSQYRDLDDFSEAYYVEVQKLIVDKAFDFLGIFNFQHLTPKTDISNIDGNRIKKIVSILSNNKYQPQPITLSKSNQKGIKDFLSKNIYPSFNSANDKKQFENLLMFFTNQKNIKGIGLKEIITNKPLELEKHSKKLNKHFEGLLKSSVYIALIEYLLDYQTIHTNREIRDLFFQNINVKICPYCNRNYVSYIEYNNSKVIGPTLDHFLSQKKHPFLLASFYNLIPSCYVCNSNLKSQKETTNKKNLNPYIDGFSNAARFKLLPIPNGYSVFLDIDHTHSNSKRISSKQKISGNAILFKLNEIYGVGHRDEIEFIVNTCDRLNSAFESNIQHIIGKDFTANDFYEFYFQNYYDESNFNKKSLSKLTRDLIDERLKWIF
ncbi:MAG: hypothetical protein Q8L81_16585 [Bacteroidota bacterium]|nr:hypothetical protein [Bacteroidota bacterium]